MYMRSIAATLILSGAVVSAIALAQNPKAASTPPGTQVAQVQAQTQDAVRASRPGKNEAQTLRPAQRRAPSDVVVALPYPVIPSTAPTGYAQPPQISPMPGTYARPHAVVQALSPEEQQQAKEFRDAVAQLRKADNDEDKKAARERLSEMISAQLDRDFEQREQKLAEIEARAKELREQLEHRRNTKSDIQKMLLMLIENPEAGLGLPPAWMNSVMSQPRGVPADPYGTPQPRPFESDPFGATTPLDADPFD